MDDESTALLFGSFYTQPARGRSPAEALRLAKTELAAKQPGPDRWAGFVLIGNP